MGGISFGWLAVWVPSPDWLCCILELCDFHSGVPDDLSLPQQPVFQAYLILNAGRYRRPWVVTQATLEDDATRAFRMAPEKFSTLCCLPSRCAIPDRTDLVLPSEFGSWQSQCA